MHLPDGFLDAKTALLSTGAATVGVGVALRQVRANLEPRQMPMLGLAAAFVFAAQMLNFPVAGGTSGHLVGGVLTAVLLGPSAAVLVMTCVLIVQCLMFADGGLMALGANVFNMAIVSVCGGYAVFRFVKRLLWMQEPRSTVCAAAFAAWVGTVLGSLFCAGELALSQTAPWSLAFPAMANVHMVIGLGEGVVTGLIALTVLRTRPEVLGAHRDRFVSYALLICLGMAVFVAPFACPWPDGLASVGKALGFDSQGTSASLRGPLADYRFPFIGSVTAATAVAGTIGTVLAIVAAYGLARVLEPSITGSKKDASPGN